MKKVLNNCSDFFPDLSLSITLKVKICGSKFSAIIWFLALNLGGGGRQETETKEKDPSDCVLLKSIPLDFI